MFAPEGSSALEIDDCLEQLENEKEGLSKSSEQRVSIAEEIGRLKEIKRSSVLGTGNPAGSLPGIESRLSKLNAEMEVMPASAARKSLLAEEIGALKEQRRQSMTALQSAHVGAFTGASHSDSVNTVPTSVHGYPSMGDVATDSFVAEKLVPVVENMVTDILQGMDKLPADSIPDTDWLLDHIISWLETRPPPAHNGWHQHEESHARYRAHTWHSDTHSVHTAAPLSRKTLISSSGAPLSRKSLVASSGAPPSRKSLAASSIGYSGTLAAGKAPGRTGFVAHEAVGHADVMHAEDEEFEKIMSKWNQTKTPRRTVKTQIKEHQDNTFHVQADSEEESETQNEEELDRKIEARNSRKTQVNFESLSKLHNETMAHDL